MNYPSMSYCMFENTHAAMEQVVEYLQDGNIEDLSERERKHAMRLVDLATMYKEIVEEQEETK